MKTIGFLISHKNGEGRRALLPEHIGKIKNADKLYFETGYGEAVGRLLRAISSPTLSSATQTTLTR